MCSAQTVARFEDACKHRLFFGCAGSLTPGPWQALSPVIAGWGWLTQEGVFALAERRLCIGVVKASGGVCARLLRACPGSAAGLEPRVPYLHPQHCQSRGAPAPRPRPRAGYSTDALPSVMKNSPYVHLRQSNFTSVKGLNVPSAVRSGLVLTGDRW